MFATIQFKNVGQILISYRKYSRTVLILFSSVRKWRFPFRIRTKMFPKYFTSHAHYVPSLLLSCDSSNVVWQSVEIIFPSSCSFLSLVVTFPSLDSQHPLLIHPYVSHSLRWNSTQTTTGPLVYAAPCGWLLAFRRNLLPQSSILEATNSCDTPSTTHNSTQCRGVKSK